MDGKHRIFHGSAKLTRSADRKIISLAYIEPPTPDRKKENYTTRATADFLFCCRKFQHGILSYSFSVWNCKYQDNNSRTRCCVQHPGRIENKTRIKWNMYTHSDYQKHKVAYLVKCFLFNLLSVSEGCVFTKWYHVSRTE